MTYRTVKISWLPKTKTEWSIFTSTRLEAARLWSDLIDYHKQIRDTVIDETWWPNKFDLINTFKKNKYNLYSQSVQQLVIKFYETIKSCQTLTRHGIKTAKYPFKKPKYKDVIYSSQQIKIENNCLILINGNRIGNIEIKIPVTIKIEGKIVLTRIKYGEIHLICKIEESENKIEITKSIGIDLGVNTLISATDGEKAINISGREAKAINQYRNKQLASIQTRQSKQIKGSSRNKKLQKRKIRMLDKCKRKIHDICHKATRKVIDFFGDRINCFIGESFNNAAKDKQKKVAQQISNHCGGKIIFMFSYKLKGKTTELNEAYSSQTCPVCGERDKCGRIYKCKSCGFTRPRDIIGSSNILSKGLNGTFIKGCPVPEQEHIKFIHPIKYSAKFKQIVLVDSQQVAHSSDRMRISKIT